MKVFKIRSAINRQWQRRWCLHWQHRDRLQPAVIAAGPSDRKKCNKSDRRRIISGGGINMIALWCCKLENDDSGHNIRCTEQDSAKARLKAQQHQQCCGVVSVASALMTCTVASSDSSRCKWQKKKFKEQQSTGGDSGYGAMIGGNPASNGRCCSRQLEKFRKKDVTCQHWYHCGVRPRQMTGFKICRLARKWHSAGCNHGANQWGHKSKQ